MITGTHDGNNKSSKMLPERVTSGGMPMPWAIYVFETVKSAKCLSLPGQFGRWAYRPVGPLVYINIYI